MTLLRTARSPASTRTCDTQAHRRSYFHCSGSRLTTPAGVFRVAPTFSKIAERLQWLDMLATDTVLQNRYRIVRLLNQGGMGAVYQASDERLDITVALKECFFDQEVLRKQFEREARLLARLRHPAITKVIDHFTEGAGQFLVMEFIPGAD